MSWEPLQIDLVLKKTKKAAEIVLSNGEIIWVPLRCIRGDLEVGQGCEVEVQTWLMMEKDIRL